MLSQNNYKSKAIWNFAPNADSYEHFYDEILENKRKQKLLDECTEYSTVQPSSGLKEFCKSLVLVELFEHESEDSYVAIIEMDEELYFNSESFLQKTVFNSNRNFFRELIQKYDPINLIYGYEIDVSAVFDDWGEIYDSYVFYKKGMSLEDYDIALFESESQYSWWFETPQ